jgi:hypothetical protein
VRRKMVFLFWEQTKRAHSPLSNANTIDNGTSRTNQPHPSLSPNGQQRTKGGPDGLLYSIKL